MAGLLRRACLSGWERMRCRRPHRIGVSRPGRNGSPSPALPTWSTPRTPSRSPRRSPHTWPVPGSGHEQGDHHSRRGRRRYPRRRPGRRRRFRHVRRATALLERANTPHYALVHARRGDRHGNVVYRHAARTFNPDCAVGARTTIAQVEHLVEPGDIDPDIVHTTGHPRPADRRRARRRPTDRVGDHQGSPREPQPRRDGRPRRHRTTGRGLRQPRRRHAHPRARLHAGGPHGRAALRERHSRRRSPPGRRRARPRPTPNGEVPASAGSRRPERQGDGG